MEWRIELRGGAYHGWVGVTALDPQPTLTAWTCGPRCGGHATFDPHDPRIVLSTAVAYALSESDLETRLAVYELGDTEPDLHEEEQVGELVGAGGAAAA